MLKKEGLQGIHPKVARASRISPTTNNRKGDGHHYDKVVGNVASSFTDLVVVGERIEVSIRHGKFTQSSSIGFAKKPITEKKKGETNVVSVELVFQQGKGNSPSYPTQIHIGGPRPVVAYTNPPSTPYPQTDVGATVSSRPTQQNTRRGPKMLAPIPMTYIELLRLLLKEKLLEIVPLKPLEPLYPRSYHLNARYDYHGRAVGHATKRCWSLKHKAKLEGASRRGREEGETECTADSAGWVEEGSHQSRPGHAEAHLVVYVRGNENPRPKPLIIHYNSASHPRVSFIIQVPTRSAYNNNAYEILDQLHKTPARASLFSLLINSEGHHNLLLKVLNEAYVA
ncbi:hypothetical protein CR513_54042, partial [Mucuna pruriens]